MVKDEQVRRLFKMKNKVSINVAAMKSGMAVNTARKYYDLNKLPSQTKKERTYKTRKDPFADKWQEIVELLETYNFELDTKKIFEILQEKYPDDFKEGQLRTLQRKIKKYKALNGKPKEVFFTQEHFPGDLSQSDFTNMNYLKVTIKNERFDHLLYHFVLTYSNWEYVCVSFSESNENLNYCLQNALWGLGGVPQRHRTDNLKGAIINFNGKYTGKEEFNGNYLSLLKYYGLSAEHTRPYSPNENGDVEASNRHFKRAIEQALMLRGSKDFDSLEEYDNFLKKLFRKRNNKRTAKFLEEVKLLKPLPKNRLDDCKKIVVRVGKTSTIRISNSTYSVNSRLIGETVSVYLFNDHLDIYYDEQLVEKNIPRMRGKKNYFINYTHIIEYLVRKPNAFLNYRYQSDLFPTCSFRIAYDYLKRLMPMNAHKIYIKILYLAYKEGEDIVDEVIRYIIDNELPLLYENVSKYVLSKTELPKKTDINIDEIDLSIYDTLIMRKVTNG